MNSKGIMIALGVLAVLVVATIVVYRPTETATTAVTDPWSRFDRARVDHITIQRPPSAPSAERTMNFEKSGAAWRMTAPGQGPTEARSLEDLVDRFADMHVTSVAGRNRESYDDFEVDDEHAVRVTLKAGSATVLDVYVGASVEGGTAVRVPGRQEIYRVDQSLHSMVARVPRDWRDRDITRIERASVASVEWVNSHGTFRFDRNGETWVAAAGTTVPRLDTARVGSLVDTVTNLRATDFADARAATGITDASPLVRITTRGDAGASTTVVQLGGTSGENEAYAKRQDSPIVFVIGRTMADALNPDVGAFQAPLPVDGGATADASAEAPPPPSPPPGGQPNIPPEVMEQLRRAMQQQGGGGAPH